MNADTPMSLTTYQAKAQTFRQFSLTPEMNMAIMALGVNGEAGEVAEKVKKHLRKGLLVKDLTQEQVDSIVTELGDVLWYIAGIAHDLGFPLSYVAYMNLQKLSGRKERGTLHGSGDQR